MKGLVLLAAILLVGCSEDPDTKFRRETKEIQEREISSARVMAQEFISRMV